MAVYIVLLAAAPVLPVHPVLVLFVVSAAIVVLLFLGIHNAWDLVTNSSVMRSRQIKVKPQ